MKKKTLVLLSLISIFVINFCRMAQGDIKQRLESGEIIVDKIEKSDVQGVKTLALIDADIDKVWNVITDCEKYKEYMPNTVDSKVIYKTKDSNIYEGTVSILGINITYRLKHTLDATNKDKKILKWEEAKGKYAYTKESKVNFKKNYGSWILERYGNKTKSTYTAFLSFSHNMPEWLEKRAISLLLSFSAPGIIKATRKRVKEK